MTMPAPPIEDKSGFVALAGWIVALGIFLMAAPRDWYGPSWFYFTHHGAPLLPEGGMGMGLCLAGIGALQLLMLWRNTTRYLPVLFFLSGFVFWTSGIILGAEGLVGHQGLIEAPLMMALGAHKFVVMSSLIARARTSSRHR